MLSVSGVSFSDSVGEGGRPTAYELIARSPIVGNEERHLEKNHRIDLVLERQESGHLLGRQDPLEIPDALPSIFR